MRIMYNRDKRTNTEVIKLREIDEDFNQLHCEKITCSAVDFFMDVINLDYENIADHIASQAYQLDRSDCFQYVQDYLLSVHPALASYEVINRIDKIILDDNISEYDLNDETLPGGIINEMTKEGVLKAFDKFILIKKYAVCCAYDKDLINLETLMYYFKGLVIGHDPFPSFDSTISELVKITFSYHYAEIFTNNNFSVIYEFKERLKNINFSPNLIRLTFENEINFLGYVLKELVANNTRFNICENCGKLFIPTSRSDEKYCNYSKKGEKSCREKGYLNKLNSDIILSTYRKIYKTQNARKIRHQQGKSPDYKKQLDNRFIKWAEFAKNVLKSCQLGEISLESMESKIKTDEWLKNI